ncbi:MAG: bifunctional 2-C-methyl-D-erythritol 4-phosphate cytidylyltransferase/2-C-methyl-D-erythritol 2,4-cyclodiphosphate synthase [Alphaproteobacteria bacterium]|nr:MAG: bifunctional 2-C-methyl-D-erythritol 4-phosphate cytidylyltransferase/2-C-methyl-D-erythritol 2,4-cyclodiphosphate synthase [Alphaproteobacteria bacterium]
MVQPTPRSSACGTAALIVAGGSGSRAGGEVPKQYQRLGGVPVLRRTVLALAQCPGIDVIQVVIRPQDRALYEEAVKGLALPDPVPGGHERQDSVRAGLEALAALAPERVLIHDAARPFVDGGTIARVVAALSASAGALPTLPVVDALWRVEGGCVTSAVDRTGLARAQTPQGFQFAEILAAHRKAAGQALPDDVSVLALTGATVQAVPGHAANIKLTTAADMAEAERRLLREGEVRVATGFDVHRFGPGDHVMLCGVAVPHDAGLDGHSDADVALHALTDALLGTIAAGDIGQHFPPSDPRWRGADSARFLCHAADLITARGGVIAHVDLTIIGERPKVSPHRAAMVQRLAGLLGLAPSRVSVKATTTEQLGFTGRREGLAAQAVATVRLPFDDEESL